MSLVYNSNKFQYAVSQSLPFGEVRRGFSFNAFNCMKAYSFNGERYGYYGYDASGERTYKYGLDRIDITTNQGDVYVTETYWEANEMMFYPNGYINMNQNGEYTKHYYADALRIASKIGSGKSGLDLCSEASIIENIYPSYLSYRIDLQREEMKEELTELVVDGEEISDITPLEYPNLCDVTGGGNESELFFYHADHLGSTGMVTDINSQVTQGLLYAPFGEIITDYQPQFHSTPMPNYAFNAKELDEENGMYYYSARYYAPPTFISRDPLFEKYPSISPYTYCSNNPINKVDPTGLSDDWVESATGEIYWDDNATSQATTKSGETYLGKNVLVATHNRDADLNEPINSATFDLYLESNKEGPSASIKGNTVPADGSTSGTLAEGLYSARFQGRASYLAKGKTDLALIINEGGKVPTAKGSPKSFMTGLFLHSGNNYQTSLFDSKGNAYSEGCLTGPCMPGSATTWNTFGQQLKGFNGSLYLRGQPQPAAPAFPGIDSSLPGINALKRW
jgi:RHS repeat-associated protein